MLASTIIGIAMLLASEGYNTPGDVFVPIATHNMSLNDRYDNSFVNTVFKDNILLTMKYMDGDVKTAKDISWDTIDRPFHYEFTLKPGEEFVFDDTILPQYKGNIVKSTNAHFNYDEGFKSDGFLTGDGVCHLASLIYWTAKDAGLDAVAPTNHNFANIPDIPKEYGVAIFSPSPEANLYITNNKDKPVKFIFDYNGDTLLLRIVATN